MNSLYDFIVCMMSLILILALICAFLSVFWLLIPVLGVTVILCIAINEDEKRKAKSDDGDDDNML